MIFVIIILAIKDVSYLYLEVKLSVLSLRCFDLGLDNINDMCLQL